MVQPSARSRSTMVGPSIPATAAVVVGAAVAVALGVALALAWLRFFFLPWAAAPGPKRTSAPPPTAPVTSSAASTIHGHARRFLVGAPVVASTVSGTAVGGADAIGWAEV